jgi:hypothetical protein
MGRPAGRKSNGLSAVLSTILSVSFIYRIELFLTSTGFSEEEALIIRIRKKKNNNVLRKIPTMVANVYFRKLFIINSEYKC